MKYKASNYNLYFDLENNEKLIYNSFTGAVTKLSSGEVEDVLHVIHGVKSDSEMESILVQQGHIIDVNFNEYESILNHRQSSISQTEVIDIILLASMNCNFKCPYCYEKRRDSNMSVEICNRAIKYILNECKKYKYVRLSWFGGEPTLNVNAILMVNSTVMQHIRQTNCTIETNITTNGYLLNNDLIAKFVNVGITHYMITVDGLESDHNSTRILFNGEGTYEKIISNIKKILEYPSTEVTVRINFNSNNAKNLTPLFEEFEKSIRKRITIVIEPIFGSDDISANGTMNNADVTRFMIETYSIARKMGFATSSSDISISPRQSTYCYAERIGEIVISPEGDLFKCSVQNFECKDRVGHIDENGILVFNEKYDEWMKMGFDFPDICKQCIHLPTCLGGCRKNMQIPLYSGKSTCAQIEINRTRVIKKLINMGYSIINS